MKKIPYVKSYPLTYSYDY